MIDREKIIKGLQIERECVSRDCDRDCGNCDLVQERDWLLSIYDGALAMLKEHEPKAPIHIHEEYPEHDWRKDKDGNIDEFAMDYGFHNGPACKRCGYSFCMHCKPNGWNEKPCVIDYYQCPKCGKHIVKNDRKTLYCERCGQAVEWNV